MLHWNCRRKLEANRRSLTQTLHRAKRHTSDQRRSRKVSSCLGWEKASGNGVGHPCQGNALAGSPSAATKYSHGSKVQDRQTGQKKEGDGKRLRWKINSREEKLFKAAWLNIGFFAKEQWRNKDDWDWTKGLREGMEWDLTAQAEQIRKDIGQENPQPSQKSFSGLRSETKIPGSNHTFVWPLSEMWK